MVQPSPSNLPPPPTMATAITSEDGTVTINIRQSSHVPPPVTALSVPPSLPSSSSNPNCGSGAAKSSSEEVYYSSNPKEDFVDMEKLSVFVDKNDLQKQYERAIYQGII